MGSYNTKYRLFMKILETFKTSRFTTRFSINHWLLTQSVLFSVLQNNLKGFHSKDETL